MLKTQRGFISQAMVFCIENAECAEEIVDCVTESLTLSETPCQTRLARLYLVSDVLHNTQCKAKNVWALRDGFEKSMPEILEATQRAAAQSGKEGETLLQKVRTLLTLWERWSIFSSDYMKGLHVAAFHPLKPYKEAASSAWIQAKVEEWELQHFSQLEKLCRLRGLPSRTSHLEAGGGKTLEQMRKGWLMDRLVGYQIYHAANDVDGEALDEAGDRIDEDLDGESCVGSDLDDPGFDLWEINELAGKWTRDGEELGPRTVVKAAPAKPAPVVLHKPEAEDPDALDIERQVDSDEEALSVSSGASSPRSPARKASELDESDRQRLREVEVQLMKLRDELEEQGVGEEQIQAQCDQRRAELLAKPKKQKEATIGKRRGSPARKRRASEPRKKSASPERKKKRGKSPDEERRRASPERRKRSRARKRDSESPPRERKRKSDDRDSDDAPNGRERRDRDRSRDRDRKKDRSRSRDKRKKARKSP